MRVLSMVLAAAALSASSSPFSLAQQQKPMGGGPNGEHHPPRGPLAEACVDKSDGDMCTIDTSQRHPHNDGSENSNDDQDKEERDDTLGVCKKMLDGDVHCHILHPNAIVCLDKEPGTECSFKLHGMEKEETGKCTKMPHGTVCHAEMMEAPGGDHMERFQAACKDKAAGAECDIETPHGMENEFKGICEEARHHHGMRNGESEAKDAKGKLRCRMLSPLEAACISKQEGSACNITMHSRGKGNVNEEGQCKKSVRGDLHCRHTPRVRQPRDDPAEKALKSALRGVGEGNAHAGNQALRKFPAPSKNTPAPKDKDEDVRNRKAPAPKKSKAPAPQFQP